MTITLYTQTATSIVTTSGSPQSATVNTAFTNPLVVTVLDQHGIPITGVTVTFTAPASGASSVFSNSTNTISAATNASGQLSEAVTANTHAGSYTVNATVGGVASPATFSLTNTAGAFASLVVASGSPQSAVVNTAFANPLVVTAEDAYSNPVSGVPVTFTAPGGVATGVFSNSTATISGTTNASGQLSEAFTANTHTGSYSVTAVSGSSTVNFNLTNTAGATVLHHGDLRHGSNRDREHQLHQSAGGHGLRPVQQPGSRRRRDVHGTIQRRQRRFQQQQQYHHREHQRQRPVVRSHHGQHPLGHLHGQRHGRRRRHARLVHPDQHAGDGGQRRGHLRRAQSAAVNSAFATPLTAAAVDQYGNPVPNFGITFAAPTTGASGHFSNNEGGISGTSNSSGLLSEAFTANLVLGTYAVTATANGIATPTSFNLTNTVGAAASIVTTSGSPQSTTVNTAFGSALAATVEDVGGNPVPGASVTFTAPASGASGVFTGGVTTITGTTNASGQVVEVFTANTTAGSYTVSAAASGVARRPRSV